MNLEDYSIYYEPEGIEVRHNPSGDIVLLTSYRVSLDTLLRVAVTDHAKRNNIRL